MKYLMGFVLLLAWILTSNTWAMDLGFRFKDGQCVNERGEFGYNPGFVGNCGDFRGVILVKFDLSNLDLRGAQFQNSQLQIVNFNRSLLEAANFSNSILVGLSFDETQMKNVDFSQAQIKKVTFFEASLEQVNFSKTQWSDSVLSYFSCDVCDFSLTNLSNLALDGSRLPKSNFVDANLTDVNLSMSNLESAIFNRALLKQSDLSKAQLMKASLQGARIKNSNFSQVNYLDTDFKGARYNRYSILPFDRKKAADLGMIFLVADCKPGVEVEYDDHCYHLDGVGGKCSEGYELAPQNVLALIGAKFIGLSYYSKVSSNCCIWHKDIDSELEDYGMDLNSDCNGDGPFTGGPTLNGAGCEDANNREPEQLTFCQSKQEED